MGLATAIAAILVILIVFGGLFYYANLEKNRIHYGDIPDAQVYARVLDIHGNQIACYVMLNSSRNSMNNHFYTTATNYVDVDNPFVSNSNEWFSGDVLQFAAMTADMQQLGQITKQITLGTNYITIQLQAAS
jgi:hypothetical protein